MASPRKKIIVSILGDIEKRNRINKAAYYFSRLTSSKLIFKNKTPKDSSKNILLPNGVNFDFFKPFNQLISKEYLDLNIEKKYILFVSNGDLSNPIKRYDKFLDVFNAFTKSEKYNSELFEILHLNKVSREKVPYYYNSASLMIVTSDHEGSPNAVKEAMACDLPIISTPVGDVPILLENVTNCYVSKSWRVDELVSLVENIDFNKRSNGRQKLIELKLDSESVAEKLINVYKSLHLNY